MDCRVKRIQWLVYLPPAAFLAACSSVSVTSPAPAVEHAAEIPGFFSAEQAERGRASYRQACSECHTLSEFQGADFEWAWRRQTAWSLYREISANMPEDRPGELSAETYADIVAYLLSRNGYQVGSADLAPTEEALAAIALGAGAPKTKTKE